MTDVADEIRKKLEEHPPGQRTMPPSSLRHLTGDPPDDFFKLRAHVRGTLIEAQRQLGGDWDVTTDRILDIVTTWMDSKRSK
jgi:hypothetical protein